MAHGETRKQALEEIETAKDLWIASANEAMRSRSMQNASKMSRW